MVLKCPLLLVQISLVSTCKLHDINVYDYLTDVLLRINQHPASQVHELTPRLWKERFAGSLLRSELFTKTDAAVE